MSPPHFAKCHDSVNQDHLASAEHWYDFGSLAGNSDLFVQVVGSLAVPNSVLQYLKAGQITPLAKPTGGHRPTPHDVFSPQTCAQISNGSQERISSQVWRVLEDQTEQTR